MFCYISLGFFGPGFSRDFFVPLGPFLGAFRLLTSLFSLTCFVIVLSSLQFATSLAVIHCCKPARVIKQWVLWILKTSQRAPLQTGATRAWLNHTVHHSHQESKNVLWVSGLVSIVGIKNIFWGQDKISFWPRDHRCSTETLYHCVHKIPQTSGKPLVFWDD